MTVFEKKNSQLDGSRFWFRGVQQQEHLLRHLEQVATRQVDAEGFPVYMKGLWEVVEKGPTPVQASPLGRP